MRRLLLPFLAASLAACTLSLPARQAAHDTPPAPAAIVQDAVTVTPLDAAPPPKPPEQPQPAPDPKPETPLSDANVEAKAPAPIPDPTPAPPPEQLACEAKGGIWSATGASPLRTCLQPTRDAGKSCRKQSDCDGLCLARSRTCAPVKPLFGCNPILQEDGTEATLCID